VLTSGAGQHKPHPAPHYRVLLFGV